MIWRVGVKVKLNVYEGDRPVCQCHSESDAQRIVAAMNAIPDTLDISVNCLELSVRPYNILKYEGLETLRDVVRHSEAEMLRYKNMGRKSLRELKEQLALHGLKLS